MADARLACSSPGRRGGPHGGLADGLGDLLSTAHICENELIEGKNVEFFYISTKAYHSISKVTTDLEGIVTFKILSLNLYPENDCIFTFSAFPKSL